MLTRHMPPSDGSSAAVSAHTLFAHPAPQSSSQPRLPRRWHQLKPIDVGGLGNEGA